MTVAQRVGSLLRVCSLGPDPVRYEAAIALMDRLAAARTAGTVPDTLLTLQHAPVYTIGKRGSAADFRVPAEQLAARGAEVVHSPRGGEVTFHGPGQVVVYPVVGLRGLRCGARAYVEGLEDALIATLGAYGLQARGRVPGRTGVWVGARKVAALGVRISHGCASHGAALNVATDLRAYDAIVPCGIADAEVTSMQRELGCALPLERVAGQLVGAFARQFGYERVVQAAPRELLGACVRTRAQQAVGS